MQLLNDFVERRDPDLPIDLTLLQGEKQLIGALTQCKKKKGGGNKDFGVAVYFSTAKNYNSTKNSQFNRIYQKGAMTDSSNIVRRTRSNIPAD